MLFIERQGPKSYVTTDEHVPWKPRFEITDKARGFFAGDFLHGQKRLEALPVQVMLWQAMVVWLELYQIPLAFLPPFQ